MTLVRLERVKLDEVELATVPYGFALTVSEKVIKLSFDNSSQLKDVLKAVFTKEPEENQGKCLRVSKEVLCLFKQETAEFINAQLGIKISLKLNQFSKLCAFLAIWGLEARAYDKFELQLGQNFLDLVYSLDLKYRKEIVGVWKRNDTRNIQKIQRIVLESSNLDPGNEYFTYVLHKVISENIDFFDLILYCRKIKDAEEL